MEKLEKSCWAAADDHCDRKTFQYNTLILTTYVVIVTPKSPCPSPFTNCVGQALAEEFIVKIVINFCGIVCKLCATALSTKLKC